MSPVDLMVFLYQPFAVLLPAPMTISDPSGAMARNQVFPSSI
jgi:hypothetical protein